MNSDTKRLIGRQKMTEAISFYLEWFGFEDTINLLSEAENRLLEQWNTQRENDSLEQSGKVRE